MRSNLLLSQSVVLLSIVFSFYLFNPSVTHRSYLHFHAPLPITLSFSHPHYLYCSPSLSLSPSSTLLIIIILLLLLTLCIPSLPHFQTPSHPLPPLPLLTGQLHPDGLILGTGTAGGVLKVWDIRYGIHYFRMIFYFFRCVLSCPVLPCPALSCPVLCCCLEIVSSYRFFPMYLNTLNVICSLIHY